jgi:hypothetical protein
MFAVLRFYEDTTNPSAPVPRSSKTPFDTKEEALAYIYDMLELNPEADMYLIVEIS